MAGSLKELAKCRMEREKEMFEAAEGNLNIRQYKTSINRSYYAVFHAMRALNILKGFDSSKHSGVIAFFNREYLKTEILDKALSVIIKNSSFLREKSDYDDFFIASTKEAETQVSVARILLEAAETYMQNIEQEQ